MLRLTPHGVIAEIPLARTFGAVAGCVKALDGAVAFGTGRPTTKQSTYNTDCTDWAESKYSTQPPAPISFLARSATNLPFRAIRAVDRFAIQSVQSVL